ncbi:MAG TPA: hypothetical protein VN615_15585 [Gaiellales bacterium]|nr:hypothetical protein [Gaiellales bacterium]
MLSTTRTLRLTAATAAALVLTTGAAQARPLAINTGQAESSQATGVYSGTYRPAAGAASVSPANNVALAKGAAAARVTLAPDRVDRIGTARQHQALAPLAPADTIVVHTTSTKGGFDWTSAAIGAATALLIALIVGGAGMTFRGRRNVALSS